MLSDVHDGQRTDFADIVAEASADAIGVFDRDAKWTLWNAAMERLSGKRAPDVVGQYVWDVFPDLQSAPSDRLIERILAGETRTHASGRYAPLRDRSGVIVGGVVVRRIASVDEAPGVTESRAESIAALERRASELEAVFRAFRDRCVRINREGRILRLIAGYPESLPPVQVEGKHIRDILDPVDASKIESALRELEARRAPVIVEYEAPRADGKHQLEARLGPFGDEVIAVLRDVSDRHRAEQALHEAEKRLRASQKMEAIGRLAGGVAHDFNNLLTIMLSCAELLARSSPTGSTAATYLADISGAAQRGAALTRQLLAFSHQQPMQPRVFALNTVVLELKAMLGRLIGENIELVTELDADAGSVRADRSQVEQVILNLVVNARDALGERGGRILLATAGASVTRAGDGHEDLAPGKYATLIVKDDGSGMTEEVKAHLFEPFFTTKPHGKGTGLGLATVYGIAKQSGGRVEVRSALGEGAELRVLFPAVNEAAPEPAATVPSTLSPGGHELVLLVEDEALLRRVVGDILIAAGYRVARAANADEALAMFEDAQRRSERIDVLLSDVVMPGLSGRELAVRLKRASPGLPVLFMSGYEERASEVRGDEPVIAKPFTASALARRVREVLDGGRREAG